MYRVAIITFSLIAFALSSTVAQAVPFSVGDIFVSTTVGTFGDAQGYVKHYRSNGTALENLGSGTAHFSPLGAAFDSAGNLYAADYSSNVVSRLAGPGDPRSPSPFAGSLLHPSAIVFAGDGHLLVGYQGHVNTLDEGGIAEFDANGNFVKTILSGLAVGWLDLAADQDTILYTYPVADAASGVQKISRSTQQSRGYVNFFSTWGSGQIRILPNGDVLVGGIYKAYQLNVRGEVIATYGVTGAQSMWSVALLPGGTEFLLGSYATGKLYRFKIEPGTNMDNQTQTINVGSAPFRVSIFGGYSAATSGLP